MNLQYTVNHASATAFLDYAERHGFALFPMVAETKRPACPWRKESSRDPAQWRAWQDQGFMLGVSACASGIVLIDVDIKVGREPAYQYFTEWCRSLGFEPPKPYCESRSGGWHFAFRCPTGFDPDAHRGLISIRDSHFRPLAQGEKGNEIISVRNRGYCVAPGSVFQSAEYRFYCDAPAPHAWPSAFDNLLRLPVVEVDAASGKAGESDRADVAKLVAELDSYGEFDTEPEWFASLGAIKLALGDTESALDVARQMTRPEATEEALIGRWTRLAAIDPGGPQVRRIGTLIHRYREITGKLFPVRRSAQAMFADRTPLIVPDLPPCPVPLPIPPVNMLTAPREEILPPDCEDAHALEIIDRHGSNLRYCEEWGRWLRWDVNRWHPDKTSAVFALVRKDLREFAFRQAFVEARKTASAKTIAAVERLARTDQRVAVTADMLDADPMALNTPTGVVDLRTGKMHSAAPDLLMTKVTAVAPDGECPTWLAFLNRSLAGDAELIGFVQRMLGYALTGDTREHALFFLFGPGGNGKGVLLNTVAGILGDYAKTSPIETFTDSGHERHPTDLAGLRGARLVTASETERGRRWAEAKIKMLTGGDRISARFMRQDFFEFMPQFKLVISGNHKPGLRSVDEAIRRRLHLIPFTVKIPAAERDAALPDKLKAEWPGIMAWLIEGCLAWQRGGLQPPAAVRAATDEYLEGEDATATWLDERCERASDGFVSRADLFASWTRWAELAREPVGTLKAFLETMRQREFEELKRNGVRGFRGVKLRDVPMAFPPCPIPLPRG